MPKQIEIEFFRYLQKIGETLAHLLSIKQNKFQLHKIKLHAIVIVKWLIPMEIRLENGFLTLSPFFFQGNGSKLVRNLVLGSYWYILGVQLMILIGDLISVWANRMILWAVLQGFMQEKKTAVPMDGPTDGWTAWPTE